VATSTKAAIRSMTGEDVPPRERSDVTLLSNSVRKATCVLRSGEAAPASRTSRRGCKEGSEEAKLGKEGGMEEERRVCRLRMLEATRRARRSRTRRADSVISPCRGGEEDSTSGRGERRAVPSTEVGMSSLREAVEATPAGVCEGIEEVLKPSLALSTGRSGCKTVGGYSGALARRRTGRSPRMRSLRAEVEERRGTSVSGATS
jgi:hypothetical protein